MRIVQSAVLTLAAALTATAGAQAEEQLLRLDPGATAVHFSVEATGHDVHGTFHLAGGEVRFDPATGAAAGEIRVDALSAVTGNRSRDKTLRGDVLEAERFPLFVFTPERLVGALPDAGEGRVELRGVVAVHGASHAITLPTRVRVDGDRVELTADFPIPYVEWGLHNPSLFFLRVADVVQVHVQGTGALERTASATLAAHGR